MVVWARAMETRWRLHERDPEADRLLARDRGVSTVLAALLRNRRQDTPAAAHAWLYPDLRRLEQPLALRDMDRAADRLHRAVRDGEPIAVYGDYDVDGMVGTVVLVRLLRLAGADVRTYIPNRLKEGYSFTDEGVRSLLGWDPRPAVVVTVDHGISAVDEIARLADAGIDIVVTDHHEPPCELPSRAHALVNPKRPGCPSENKLPCGAAVAEPFGSGLSSTVSTPPSTRQAMRAYAAG